eukprot:s313_g1.t2
MDSKGERLLAAAMAPVVPPLPRALRGRWRLSFDQERLRLREKAAEILEKAVEVGSFSPSRSLEEYQARPEIFRSFTLRQELHRLVEASPGFLEVYEQLLLTVLLPWLKELCATPEQVQFWYQYPPTLRVQPGRSKEFKRPHRDAEYGHQIGELNCWMPLTEPGISMRWVESEPDRGTLESRRRGDYEPLDISYGQIGIFHGTLCRHHVPENSSEFTRVSMDFRIGLGEYFDPRWQLDGVKHVHGRREIWL